MRFAHVPGNGGLDTAARIPRVMTYGEWAVPHAAAAQDTLVVAANKLLHIRFARLFLHQRAAPTSTAQTRMYYTFQPNGGSESNFAWTMFENVSDGNPIVSETPLDFIAVEDDTIRIWTQDLCTGGQITYVATLYYNEYNV